MCALCKGFTYKIKLFLFFLRLVTLFRAQNLMKILNVVVIMPS